MRSLLLTLFLVLFTFPVISAQADHLVDQANLLLDRYVEYYQADRVAEARSLLDQGISMLEGQAQDTLLGKYYNLYTYWYFQEGNLDQALAMQVRAVRCFAKGYGPTEPTAFAMHNAAFLFQRVHGQADSALHYYQQGLAIYKELSRPLDIADEYRNIGLVHLSQNRYSEAQDAYMRALAALQEMSTEDVDGLEDSDQLLYVKTSSWLYLNLAELKMEIDDIRQGRVYLTYSQDILEHYAERFPELQQEVLENEARVYEYLGQYQRSIDQYRLLLDSLPLPNRSMRVRGLARIQRLYHEHEQYDKAILTGEELNAYEQQFSSEVPLRQLRNTRQLAEAYLELGNLAAARQKEQEASGHLLQVDQPQQAALQHVLRARILRKEGEHQAALREVDTVFAVHDFPVSVALSGSQALKSDITFSLYKDTGQASLLDTSEYWARQSWATLLEFETQTFRQRSFAQNYRRPTECLLQVLFERYRLQPEDQVLQEIFTYLETIRGRSLKLGRQWRSAYDAQHEAYEELRRRYLQLLKERYQLENKDEFTEDNYRINDSLVNIGQQLDQLKSGLGKEKWIALSEIQQALPDDRSAALLYFVGKDNWFGMALTRRKVVLYQAPINAGLKAEIVDFKTSVKDLDASAEHLAPLSYGVYQKVLFPLLRQLHPEMNRLLISADGLLSGLPWPSVCTALPQGKNFRNWPFLIKKYQLSYLPSVSELVLPNDRHTDAFSVACFSPVYPEQIDTAPHPQLAELYRSGFWALPGAQEETQAIFELYGPRVASLFSDEKLTSASFLEHSRDYAVLHLAMHAVADYEYPDESYLLFPSPNQELEYLTTLDLLTLGLDADLLVLSACYAGDGPWRPGDGVLSLAYALRQAGAGAVLSNYWATADQLSKGLMIDFHHHLKTGKRLDEALRLAQENYLKQVPLEQAAHPFYWAGFHLQGNLAPLNTTARFWPWWYLLPMLALIGLFYGISRRRSSAS